MWVMFDSVDVREVPVSANAVAGYLPGRLVPETFREVQRRWPHSQHLSIAVTAAEDADCLDVEKGDASPEQAPGWFKRQRELRPSAVPVLYRQLSGVAELEAIMQRAGIARREYRVWSAHWTGVAHLCGHACGLTRTVDATQWTDKALGRNLDESLVSNDFFATRVSRPAPPVPWTRLEQREVALYDRLARHPRLHPVGLGKVRRRLVALRKEVWAAANAEIGRGRPAAGAWRFRGRRLRYEALWSRTRGFG